MGMEQQVLSPGMQDARNPISAPRCLGSAATSSSVSAASPEQQVIEHRRIALTEPVKLMRQSKHNVKVRQPEQFLFPGSEPSLARLRLTLGAVAIAARVKRDGRMIATGTVIQMAAQALRAAALDSGQHLQVLEAQPGAILFNKAITMCAK